MWQKTECARSIPSEVERHERPFRVLLPEFDGPVSRGGQEDTTVEFVPLNAVDTHVVPVKALCVVRVVRRAALTDLPLFCADNEFGVLQMEG